MILQWKKHFNERLALARATSRWMSMTQSVLRRVPLPVFSTVRSSSSTASPNLFASMAVFDSSPESVLGILVTAYRWSDFVGQASIGLIMQVRNQCVPLVESRQVVMLMFLFNCSDFNWDAFYFVRNVEGNLTIWDVLFNEDRPSSFSRKSVLDLSSILCSLQLSNFVFFTQPRLLYADDIRFQASSLKSLSWASILG